MRVQPGLHRVRRLAGRGLRREDRQGHGSRAEDRVPADRHQRRRGRADPGGRGRARAVRRDLLPQRDRLRRDPADLPDHGAVRGRRGLLPRDHRLHAHGRGHLAHVHHRARRHQDRDRGGGLASRSSGARTRTTSSPESPTTRPRTRTTASTSPASCCPTCRPTTWTTRPSCLPSPGRGRGVPDPLLEVTDSDAALDTLDPRLRPTSPTTPTPSSPSVLDDREFLEVHALFAPNILRRVRPGRGRAGRGGRQPADAPGRGDWTSTRRRRRRGSSAPATPSTSRC